MTADPAPRPTFYQRQWLGPEDLDAIVRYGVEHSARHALGAHTWGIGAGLAIVASQSPGGVEYWVQPGVAWDGFGRTLLLPAPVRITPDHLQSQPYNPATDALDGPGQLVDVWLRFREDATTPPLRGYNDCDDGGFARSIERVDIVVGKFAAPLDTQQLVDVGGLAASPRDAVGAWYPAAPIPPTPRPTIEDGSIAFQRFPDATETSRWLVPIGFVRWKAAAPGSLGAVGSFELPQPEDDAITRQRRRLVGVVAGTVLGAEGILRLRPRAMPAPSVWTDEPLWLEGNTRLDGDLRLFGAPNEHASGGIDFRDGHGTTRGRAIRISRHEQVTGSDLRVQLGLTGAATVRLVVGTEAPGPTPTSPPVFTESMVVTSNGRVGIGVPAPETALHVSSQPAQDDAHYADAHVALIENGSDSPAADVLALRVGTPATEVGPGNNFITFFAGATAIGRIEGTASGSGVQFISSGADFAESVPAAAGEKLGVGDVVAVVAGRATHATENASWISVVTDRAIVLGNAPSSPTPADVAVTMLGQVPVKVRGKARPGDLLVPSGEGDGAALAYAAAEIPVQRADQAFGEVVRVVDVEPDSVIALVGAHARSSALIAIVQRLHARAG